MSCYVCFDDCLEPSPCNCTQRYIHAHCLSAMRRKGFSGEDASSIATRSTPKVPESAGTAKAADVGAKLGDFQKAEEAAARMRDMGFASPEVPDREEPARETEEASDESRR